MAAEDGVDRVHVGCAEWRGRRVLVTGGLGFIGSNLAMWLSRQGAEVTVLDTRGARGRNDHNIDDPDWRGTRADLRGDAWDEMAGSLVGQEVLFNLAGRGSHIGSLNDPIGDLEANCRYHLGVLECCRQVNRTIKIVYASTRQVYGRPDYLPVDEAHDVRPVDVNGIHKLAAERYHLLYREVYGIDCCVLRLTNVYGPRMNLRDPDATFLGRWIRQALRDDSFEVWGGQQSRDLLFVDDCVQALAAAARSPSTAGRVLNVGGFAARRLEDLAHDVVRAAGGGRYVRRAFPPADAQIEIGDYESDDRLFRRMTGWAPRHPIDEGLDRTMAFFRDRLHAYA